jgi:uncharacterized membrane protein
MTPPSMTDSIRRTARGLFIVVTVGAVGGWALGRDPAMLAPVIGWVVMALGIGEASNVGKRATTKPELMPSDKESS